MDGRVIPAFIQNPPEEKLITIYKVVRSIALMLIAVTPVIAGAQHDHDDHDADDDHHHAPLHFAHPMFTESPSPDTKIRLDYFHTSIARGMRDNAFRMEGEYAFTRGLSIEASVPVVSRTVDGDRTTAVGSTEVALKLASFSAAKYGFLLGGGIAFELPTVENDAGIGNDHLVQIEPYVDFGYMRGPMELVSFASFSTAARRRSGEENEQELAIAASLLYHIGDFEPLVEVGTSRVLTGDESGEQSVNVGLGLKYHVPKHNSLVIGVAARAPVTSEKEFRNGFLASLFYHF